MSNQSKSQIKFTERTIGADKLIDHPECHWKTLSYEEGTLVAPPRMTWRTYLGWGDKDGEAKDEI